MLKGETVQISTQGVSPEKVSKMEEKNRKTGIDVVGDAPFGTHFCLFYETKEDLIDVLVPYFKAGLESNEFCMWVTSEPLSEEEAKEAMRRAVPNFDGYVERGQIEIVPYTEWYLKGGVFNFQRVLNGWVEKLNQALAKGYDGMRVTGNTAWLEKRDWKNFVDYEQDVNDVIGKYRMIVICTYLLDKCGASEVIDVIRNHQFAVIKREGEWELIESSELKRSKGALRKSEKNVRNIFESATDCMIFLDKSGRILDVNKETVKVFGGSREELLGRHIARVMVGLVSPKDIPMVMNAFLEGIAGKKPHIEVSLKNKKGQVIHLDCSNSLLKIDDKSYGLLVIARDITERKKAEESLRESEQRFRCLVEDAAAGVGIIDLKGRFTYVNKRLADSLGYSVQELAGRPFKDFLHPDDRGKVVRLFLKSILLRRPLQNLEFRVIHKDGHVLHCVSKPTRLIIDGKTVGFQAIIIDITERKQVEQALRESEEKYRSLFANMLNGFAYCRMIFDEKDKPIDFVYLEVNDAFEKLTGLKKEDVIGKKVTEAIPGTEKANPELFDIYSRVALTGKEEEFEIFFKPLNAWLSISVYSPKKGYFVAVFENITERKKTEEALRASEEKHRVISGITADVVFSCVKVAEEGFAIDWMAGATEKMFGYSAKEIKDKGCWKFTVQPQDLPTFEEKVTGLKPGQSSVCELRITHKDGSTRWIKVSSKIIKDSSNPTNHRLFGACRDITERKKAEDALLKSESKYRTLLENVPQKIFFKDRNSVYVSCNESYARDLKIKSNEILGKTDYDFYPKEFAEKYRADDKRIMESGKTEDIEEEYIQDGQKVFVHTVKTPVKDENGNVIGILGIFWDITERKQMEKTLRESEEKWRSLVKNAPNIILIVDRDDKIQFINRTVIDASPEEVIGRSIYDFIDPKHQDVVRKTIRQVFQTGEGGSYEISGTGTDGGTSWYATQVGPIKRDGQIVSVTLITVDITERKNMEEQLKEYSEHLEEKVEERTNQLKKTQEQLLKAEKLAAIGEVANMVGHDLRNPLQVLTNTLYTSEKKSKSIPITEKEILEKHGFLDLRSGLKEQVEYMEKIVSDLQDYARPVKPTPVEIGLHQLINKTLSSLTVPENVKASIVIEKDFPKLTLDPTLMQRVFSNLITNAVQAMPNGGKLTIRASKKEETALISIEDTGEGISDENLSKIFTPLFTTKAKGQGFGLPVCKRLVEAHDGNITVESKLGKGSTFTIKIPLRKEVSYN